MSSNLLVTPPMIFRYGAIHERVAGYQGVGSNFYIEGVVKRDDNFPEWLAFPRRVKAAVSETPDKISKIHCEIKPYDPDTFPNLPEAYRIRFNNKFENDKNLLIVDSEKRPLIATKEEVDGEPVLISPIKSGDTVRVIVSVSTYHFRGQTGARTVLSGVQLLDTSTRGCLSSETQSHGSSNENDILKLL